VSSSAPNTSEAVAEAVADAVRGVPDVRLHESSAVGTHMPGRRVPGVRLKGDDVEVHVSVVYPTPVDTAARAVRAALAGLVSGRVDVVIDDVVHPDDGPDEGTSEVHYG